MSKLLGLLEDRLSNEFERIEVNGLNCFRLQSGEVVNLIVFNDRKAIAAQYAENIDAAKCNLFEDGELWYTDEMTEDEIFDSLLMEMRNS